MLVARHCLPTPTNPLLHIGIQRTTTSHGPTGIPATVHSVRDARRTGIPHRRVKADASCHRLDPFHCLTERLLTRIVSMRDAPPCIANDPMVHLAHHDVIQFSIRGPTMCWLGLESFEHSVAAFGADS